MKRLSTFLVFGGVFAVLVLLQGLLSGLFSSCVLYGFWKVGVGLCKGPRIAIAEGVVIALVAGLLAVMMPVAYTYDSQAICPLCGTGRRQQATGKLRYGPGPPESIPQTQEALELDMQPWDAPVGMIALPAWYREHFGSECRHVWKLIQSRTDEYASLLGIRLPCTTALACGRGQRYPWLDEEAAAALTEKFDADPEACAAYLRDACWQFIDQRQSGVLAVK